MTTILFLKADQLAHIPTLVSGHTRKDGTAVSPHMSLRAKKVEAPKPEVAPASPLEAYVAKHGGWDRLRFALGPMSPEQRAKLVDAMAHLGGVDAGEVLRHLGIRQGDIGREEQAADAPPDDTPAAAAPTSDPEVEDAEDREDLASAMASDPHSDRSKSIIHRLAERLGMRRGS